MSQCVLDGRLNEEKSHFANFTDLAEFAVNLTLYIGWALPWLPIVVISTFASRDYASRHFLCLYRFLPLSYLV
jgi:hypothetical protein